MVKGACAMALIAVAFVAVSTLTTIEYGTWRWLSSGFGVVMVGVAFTFSALGPQPHWYRGFAVSVAGLAASVAAELLLVAVAADRLVQLPYEHHDYLSSGAASVPEFLAGGGWTELWTTSVFSAVVMAGMLAIASAVGSTAGRFWLRHSTKAMS